MRALRENGRGRIEESTGGAYISISARFWARASPVEGGGGAVRESSMEEEGVEKDGRGERRGT